MDEHFDNAWSKVRAKSVCPLASGAVGQYFNKAAFTSLDKSNFGTSVQGSAGGDNRNDMSEGSFIKFRTNIRGGNNFGFSGVERFDGSVPRSQNMFQPPGRASLVSMNKGYHLPNAPMNLSAGRFGGGGDPTSYLQ